MFKGKKTNIKKRTIYFIIENINLFHKYKKDVRTKQKRPKMTLGL